jgi:hypothetical protein
VDVGADVQHPEQADADAGLDEEDGAGGDAFVAPLARHQLKVA